MAGAPGDDDGARSDNGAVHIWNLTGGSVTAEKVVTGADWREGDRVGTAVAIDGTKIAAAGLAGSGPGAPLTVRTIDVSTATSTWSFRETLTVGVNRLPNDYVDLEGATLALGRPAEGGVVYLFQDSGDGFGTGPAHEFIPTERVIGDRIGFSLELDGSTAIAGAPGDGPPSDAGSVYSFAVPTPEPLADPTLGVTISTSNPAPVVGVSSIDIADLPATASQGYGGTTSDYAGSSLETLDLRADLSDPNSALTPLADVTLGDLDLAGTPITDDLLDSILLAEVPIAGGWSAKLGSGSLLVETSITFLDLYENPAYSTIAQNIKLGELGLDASNLGSISTYAALLAGLSINDLPNPNPDPSGAAVAYWCQRVADVGLGCARDFGVDPTTGAGANNLTLPILSFAGVDVETGDLLGQLLVDGADVIDLVGTPIGRLPLGELDLGTVPLASQPLVPSKSLPSYLPTTSDVPSEFDSVTLGDLGGAAPLAALTPADVGLAGAPLSTLKLDSRPDSPLQDYVWAPPAAGASLLLSNEDATLPTRLADVPLWALGSSAPILSLPLDDLVIPSSGRAVGDFTLGELFGSAATAPFGASPFGASPFGASPFGASPFGASPFGASPFGASPFGASPFGASPFGASPFGASPFGASPFGASPFGASPFGASPFGASPFGASPFGASPFGASPFGASPFGASPFGASPFGASPFGASPFGASPFGASPLSELGLAAPITAIPLSGSVRTRALSSYRLDELADTSLLFDLPISPFIGTTLLDCNLIDCRQPFGFTIGDAVAAGAMLGSATLGDLQPGLSGLAVADLVGTHPDFTESALRTFVGAITLTLAGAEAAGLGVDGVPVQLLDAYDTTTLSEARLLFSGWRLVDIGGLAAGLETSDLDAAIAAWGADQTTTGQELTIGDLTRKLPVADTNGLAPDELWADTLSLGTIADAVVRNSLPLLVDDVWPLLAPLRLEHLRLDNGTDAGVPVNLTTPGATDRTLGTILGRTTPPTTPSLDVLQRLEGLLWGDIIGGGEQAPLPKVRNVVVADIVDTFAGITLGEFLRAAQPISDQDIELFDFSAIDLADYSNDTGVTFDVEFTADNLRRTESVRIAVSLPPGSRYVEGSAGLQECLVDEPCTPVPDVGAPTLFGDSLVWQIASVKSAAQYTISFGVRSPAVIGPVTASAQARLLGADVIASSSTTIEFVEAFEPNDAPTDFVSVPRSRDINSSQIALSQIADSTDVDLFRFNVSQPGTRIGAVLSNLPADFDLTIIGPTDDPLGEPSGRVLESVGDSQTGLTPGGTSALADAGQYQPPDGFSVIARSTGRGTSPETIDPIPVLTTGDYYLVVSGYDGASSPRPFALQLNADRSLLPAPDCQAVTTTFPNAPQGGLADLAARGLAVDASTNTLFVLDNKRFGDQYGAAAAADVLAAIQRLATAGGAVGGLGLNVGVVDLAATPVAAKYAAWDATPCSLRAANDVVDATISVLNGIYASSNIENVVIVGSDKMVPFARLVDRTFIGNEQNYALTFADDRSTPMYAAKQAGTFFSDDPYADPTPSLVDGRALYVPEFAIGRLVEDPASIVGQLDGFVARDGLIRTDSALVSGYDFLLDSSRQIADDLGAGPIQTPVVELLNDTWSAQQLDDAFLPIGAAPGVAAINGHFSHQGAQSANGSATNNQNDAIDTLDTGATNFAGSLVYSVGCHSGLSVSEDITSALGDDWAQAFARTASTADLGKFLGGAGMLANKVGPSTMGTLLATAATPAPGKVAMGKAELAPGDLVAMLQAAEQGIQERGKAQLGDKTILYVPAPGE